VAGKSLLLVDTSLNNPPEIVQGGVDKLHDRGWGEMADLYMQKLFGGRLPTNTAEMFQQFLGQDVKMAHKDIRRDETPSDTDIAAVLFGGSPANVSDALANPGAEVRPGVTHGEVFQRAVDLYQEAAQAGVPIIGICYGHQLISQQHGGEIRHGKQFSRIGMEHVKPTQYGTELLAGVLGHQGSMEGDIAGFHGDAVAVPSAEQSALILRASDRDPQLVQGLLHISEGQFTGDAQEDVALVNSLLEDKQRVDLTVQGHPEFTGAERLMSFSLREDLDIMKRTHGQVLTADMLGLFTNFINRYGRAA